MAQKKQVKSTKKVKAKPDFHVTDRILFVSLMLLVFSASATLAATKTNTPAKVAPAAKAVASVVSPVFNGCASKLLLGGKTIDGQNGLLSAVSGSATTYEKLNAAIDAGCGLRFVKNGGSGGGSGRLSMDCGYAHTEDGDNVFYCDSYTIQNGKSPMSVKEGFRFENDKVYYIGAGTQPVQGSADVKLYQY